MLTLVEPKSVISGRTEESSATVSDCDVRTLHAGETLFREGDARSHIYRVERGALCLFKSRPDGAHPLFAAFVRAARDRAEGRLPRLPLSVEAGDPTSAR